MDLKAIITTSFDVFFKWSKVKLVKSLVQLRDKYLQLQAKVNQLEEEIVRLRQQLEQDKIKAANKEANRPSSKQAEWEKEGPKDKDKKRRKRKKRKPRPGAGNRPKDLTPNQHVTAAVEKCDLCGKDLSDQPALESTNERIIVHS